MEDTAGHVTRRSRLEAFLGGRPFDRVQLDVSPRGHELEDTDFVPLPNSLAFADIHACPAAFTLTLLTIGDQFRRSRRLP